MNHEISANRQTASQHSNKKNIKRLKILGGVFTLFGIALFLYFIYSVGVAEILAGVGKIGFGGFAIILLLYLVRLIIRSAAWSLSVNDPYRLSVRHSLPAVIIGEALSSVLPLGILISGTAKAVAIRKRIPLVAGLASVATENLFYSITTGLFICLGAFAFLRRFELPETYIVFIDLLILLIILSMMFGILMVVRQWHWMSGICNWLFRKGVLKSILERGRVQVRLFEDLIFGFYRKYPRRFFPITILEVLFHFLGIVEVWFILSRLSSVIPEISTAFYLETISRLITILFKLVPFVVGVDEAGSGFITETLAIGAGIGVTLAIVRKGRIIVWAAVGMFLLAKRGLSIREISGIGESPDLAISQEN
ncbi:MAG: lysylphosphatidylglycerol synthase domain-containing protein [Pyrinomonadaceae bacterium]